MRVSSVKAVQRSRDTGPGPSRFTVGVLSVCGALQAPCVKGQCVRVFEGLSVRGCVNATSLSWFDTPYPVCKPTFLGPTRPSKAQMAKFDSTSKGLFFSFPQQFPKM